MNRKSSKTLVLQRRAAAAFLAVSALVVPAWPASALTDAEIRCRDVASRLAREGAENTLAYRLGCIRRRFHDSLSLTVDCSADPAELGGSGTGDLYTDRRLAELSFLRQDAGITLIQACEGEDPMAPEYIDPADVGLDQVCPGGSTDWTEVGACVVDLGIRSIDNIMEMFDLQIDGPVPESHERCLIDIHSQIKRAFRTMARMRAACFKDDDRAAIGGGVHDCGASVMPYGTMQTSGYARLDKQLPLPIPRMERVIRNQCDFPIDVLGFEDAIPENAGGRFTDRTTLDLVFDGLNDQLQEAVHAVSFGTDGTNGIFPVAARGGYCGDGVQDGDEECDDGNNTTCDGCDRDCTLPVCGNGALCAPEECDDGNNADGDGCDSACVSERCMNGELNPGYDEECDDGAESFGCDTDCTIAYCGDGYNNAVRGEVCDVGMGAPLNSATCDSDCTAPACPDGHHNPFNTAFPAPGGGELCDDGGNSIDCDANCTPALCGDNFTNPARGEQCDDGNNDVDDSCVSSDDVPDSNCQIAFCGDGFVCTDGSCTSGPTGGTEACDDGTGTPADSAACDDDCSLPSCGDGNLNNASGEACDDGVLTGNTRPCTGSCEVAICGDGNVCSAAGCTTGPGAGVEACDDGDGDNNNACRDNCAVATCGDGVVCSGLSCTSGPSGGVEQCDTAGQTASCDSDCSTASCGDSQTNSANGETCDTGGNSATCDGNCTSVQCTDGWLNTAAGEVCDDGNVTNTDPCRNNCQVATCGDSVVCSGAGCNTAGLGPEQCDAGGETMGCDLNCTTASCGDGTINLTRGEECDDGIATAGCDANCSAAWCGDGTNNAAAGETCDDGDDNNNDPCPDDVTAGGACLTATCGDGFLCTDISCTTGPFGGIEQCDNGGANSNVVADACRTNCRPAYCGDGVVDTSEACDDGNGINGDGCDNNCTVTACGNGIITPGEVCDDGNLTSGDGCDANCTITACGNGITTGSEACDDGNPINGDGCDTNCTIPACGNGIVAGAETCDDSNLTDGDGCDSNCTPTGCGNGVVTAGETCDDSNVTDGDGCDSNCTPTGCGNGIVTAPEVCDQGGLNGSGSGFCLADCTGIAP